MYSSDLRNCTQYHVQLDSIENLIMSIYVLHICKQDI